MVGLRKYGPFWIGLLLCAAVLVYALTQSSPSSSPEPLQQIRQQDTPNSRR